MAHNGTVHSPAQAGVHFAIDTDGPIAAPDLSKLGFTAVEVRRNDGTAGGATVVSYRNGDGAALSLIVSNGRPRLSFASDAATHALVWSDDGGLYGLVGDASPALLDEISRYVSESAAWPPALRTANEET